MADDTQQLRKNYVWNAVGSTMGAASSVLLLMAVTRLLGVYVGGIFSLAFAVGQQFQVIGQFEIRPYQATDMKHRFSFSVYLAARCVTCATMVAGIIIYACISHGFTLESLTVVFVACLKLPDAFEDVYHGMFQQQGRLDIAGKALFIRSLTTTLSFVVSIACFQSLAAGALMSLILSGVAIIVCDGLPARAYASVAGRFSWKSMLRLLLTCVPLCVSSFLFIDLINIARYGIEGVMTKSDQTIYTILYMPAMVINLFVGFLLKPLLTSLALRWEHRQIQSLVMLVVKVILLVCVATVVTLGIAYVIGIPVLSALYAVDLTGYQPHLMLFIIGGACNALGTLFYYLMVTIRLQRLVLVGYVVADLSARLASTLLIGQLGMMGAALTYVTAMGMTALVFALCSGVRIATVAHVHTTTHQ